MASHQEMPEHLERPPDSLSPRAQELFRHVIATGIYDAVARTLLIEYLTIGDQIHEVRRQLQDPNTFVFTDKHQQPRIHPLRKHELTLVNEFGKLFRLLGWDQAPPDGVDPQLGLFSK